ncbi:MAG: (d)CMP kinase, partial [Leeuwenhoekiella sp.]
MKKITIAIDGYSSTGKSTIAKMLAKELSYIYVDTGAMYRAVTLYAMRKLFVSEGYIDEESLVRHLFMVSVSFKRDKDTLYPEIHLGSENVEKEIRNLKVSNYVSQVAAIPEVRKLLVKEQRHMSKGEGL